MTERNRMIWAGLVVALVASVAAGWLLENRASSTVSAASSDAYRVRVTQHGRELASYDLAALQAMEMKKVVAQGGVEEGPTLLEVLKRAGVTRFTSLTLLGMGKRDGGRLELSFSDVGSDTVLDFAKRGTVKVAGPSIPRDKRVRDITEIQVN